MDPTIHARREFGMSSSWRRKGLLRRTQLGWQEQEPLPEPTARQQRQRPACAGRAGGEVMFASACERKLCVCGFGRKLYLVQLVDQELRLQLDLVGSIEPLAVREQAQLQLDRLQEDRLQDERLQDERLQ